MTSKSNSSSSPLIERILKIPPESKVQELKRLNGTRRLKEQLLQTPFYAERAKYHRDRFGSDEACWDRMYASCANRT